MKKVYIVDYIGIHCGMHYYLESFKKIMESINGIEVEFISNFTNDDRQPLFLNMYKGSKLNKGLKLIQNLFRFKKFVKKHINDYFIYLSYGNRIDILFLEIICKAPHHCIDIHEAVAQCYDSNSKIKQMFKRLYQNKIQNVISHSERTDNFLKEYKYSGKCFFVPHFKYIFPKDFNEALISDEVRNGINKNAINILFFGNITKEKGIDTLLEAINLIPDEDAKRINVIIAGKDFDGSYKKIDLKMNRSVKFIIRHISDEELRFLYSNVDYLALPYRKTSQSGILEMAFYFKRPIIATDIPYFKKVLSEYPSFGVLSDSGSINYSRTIHYIINTTFNFFEESEYAKYENRKEIDIFLNDIKYGWIKK